jgi:hypothetical protein
MAENRLFSTLETDMPIIKVDISVHPDAITLKAAA